MQNAPREHSAILLTFIKLPFVFETFVLSIFEWLLKTGFTVSVTSKLKMDMTLLMDNNGLKLFALLFAQSFAVLSLCRPIEFSIKFETVKWGCSIVYIEG